MHRNKHFRLKYSVYRPLDSAARDGRTSRFHPHPTPPARNYAPGTVTIIPSGPVVTQWSKCELKILKNSIVRMLNDPEETSLVEIKSVKTLLLFMEYAGLLLYSHKPPQYDR